MAEINATVSDAAANSYLSQEDADQLMDLHEAADDWDALEEEAQKRILTNGTRIIDRYQNWGPALVTGQALVFPTKKDPAGAIPKEVKNALVEYAAMKAVADIDHLKKLQAEGVTNATVLGQGATFKADDSELPAGARKELDGLWTKYSAARVSVNPPCHRIPGNLF